MSEASLRALVAGAIALIGSLGGVGGTILVTGENLGAARATATYWERYAGEIKEEVLACRAR